MHTSRKSTYIILIALTLALSGCQSTYYKTMEGFGYHKRDILVSDVEKARESQEEASEQFKSALEKFSALTRFHGGDLQEVYERLNDEFEHSEAVAKEVTKRINNVEEVGNDLFSEWNDELSKYTNKKLRNDSRVKLSKTKNKFKRLLSAMRNAEKKIDPVLNAFRDQVLYLKHNLNAQAIASLQSEISTLETDIGRLIADMQKSINEADAFLKELKKNS
ncbi:MAG: DNA repair protein [Desulfovibrio sp. S3730MH75]|nr:MAG: DNA repair protein [Desulfovibrio sp. S3730MH75]